MTENIGISKTIKVFYMHHQDGMNRLSPVLLLDGGRIWHVGVKNRIGRNRMYYLFYDIDTYIKLWRDTKGHLLYFIDNYHGDLFFDEEPDVFAIDVALSYLKWDDEAIYYGDGKKIEFSVPVLGVIRKLNPWATRPLVYLLFQMFAYESPITESSPLAPADAESTSQDPERDPGQNPSQG